METAAPKPGKSLVVDDASALALLEHERSAEVVEATWAAFLERQKQHSDRMAQQRQQHEGDPAEASRRSRASQEIPASWGGFLERQDQHVSTALPPQVLSARRGHRTWEYQIQMPRGDAGTTAWVEGRDLLLSPRVDPGTRRQLDALRATALGAAPGATKQGAFGARVRAAQAVYAAGPFGPRMKSPARARGGRTPAAGATTRARASEPAAVEDAAPATPAAEPPAEGTAPAGEEAAPAAA